MSDRTAGAAGAAGTATTGGQPAAAPILQVDRLCAWYGDSQALDEVSFEVRSGELVTLVGRNGAGKSTILRAIMGLIARRSGSIRFAGHELVALLPEAIARHGIGYCPEERGIFATLTVAENLVLPPVLRDGGMSLAQIHALFPNLAERSRSPGTKLSGGEQQMLAIARILRTGARLLLLDEPTEGLAPVIVQQIRKVLETLKTRGFTILLVEQNFRFASALADRHYVVENGRIVDEIVRSQMQLPETIERLNGYIGV